MLILYIFWVWLISLVAQPVAIIILAVKNRNYKKQISELSKALNGADGPPPEPVEPGDTVPERPAGPPPVEQITVVIKQAASQDCTEPAGSTAGSPPPDAPVARVRQPFPKPDMNLFQGAAALIIGVVFVVLAGLIFATTTWQTLPNISKIIMILGFSGGFFGVSRIASKILKIKKTSQAFYILGSVFLFLTVLAVGYFELPGHGFTLAEQQRFNVLFAGSLVTELALLAGIRQFKDRVYTNACFWGISTTIFFLVKALGLETADCIKWMACYSTLLIWFAELTSNKREEMPPYMNAGFSSFAGLHFGIFSLLLVMLASREWLAAMAGHLMLNNSAVSVSTAAVFGITTTGIAVIARKQGRRDLQALHSVLMLLFWHYLGMCIRTGLIYQIFAGFILTVLWFFGQKKKGRIGSVTGASCHTLVLAIDTIAVMLIALVNRNSIGEFMAASVSVMMLTAVLEYWSRQYPGLRVIIPVSLLPLTITIEGIITLAGAGHLEYHWLVFLFLAAVVVWDVAKRDRFGISILVIGTVAQLFFWAADRNLPVFSLLLSGYLLIKSGFMEADVKELYEQGSCLCLLAGIFFITDYWTDKFMLQILCVTAAFAVAYAIEVRRGAAGRRFWAVTGLVLLWLNQGAFYLDANLSPAYIIPCLLVFTVFYSILYSSGSQWLPLLAALSVLPMPQIAASRYALTGHQFYGITAAALLVSGLLARRCFPVIICRGEVWKDWKFDWFHILVVLILLPMTWTADAGWRCAYLVLMALYVLQYTAVESLRQTAITIAAALLVLAFQVQPFLDIPELIYREVQLIPVVLFLWLMGMVWQDKAGVTDGQTVLYCLCLGVLVTDALRSGAVVDALILEAVCLFIFLWANIRKNVFWLRISGTVIVAVALYMTKDFWLSLSWWVYLLAAGLGLIVFAAANEMKKRKE